ncbi:MAG TPA: transcriptional regulator [Polyangiaceae bacterium]|nr:transcriptional regulator [Polyangiaceae bacterium]
MMRRSYSSYAEFEREEIRPSFKIGFSIDDLEEATFEAESLFDETGDDFEDDFDSGSGR